MELGAKQVHMKKILLDIAWELSCVLDKCFNPVWTLQKKKLSLWKQFYCKTPKNSDTQKIALMNLNFEQGSFTVE